MIHDLFTILSFLISSSLFSYLLDVHLIYPLLPLSPRAARLPILLQLLFYFSETHILLLQFDSYKQMTKERKKEIHGERDARIV
ncbi:hypothetical protein V8C44DRAFT_341313 [Trichoderma aethiopicum]